mmetsp:Transcript_13132/g.30597  ORF Transcript_13132/g.30597 Transcript_13132/m.30597 type:complete len:231 (+) Transcript_13132:68-760(+)
MNRPEQIRKLRRITFATCQQPSVKRVKTIASSLPARLYKPQQQQQNNKEAPVNPEDFLLQRMRERGLKPELRHSLSQKSFFSEPSDEEVASYGADVLNAVRTSDIQKLRQLKRSGRPLKCSNEFGESLLHLACRKSNLKVATVLIKEAGVTVRVRDDYGRTPLHDACWTVNPNFELIDLILRECPDLLWMKDKRGHTPLSYVTPDHWPAWVQFLLERESLLIPQSFKLQR